MKYLAAALAFTGYTALTQAQSPVVQEHRKEIITAEQQAEIRSKTLALHLDLDKMQQESIMKLEKNMITKRKAIRDEAQTEKEVPLPPRDERGHHRSRPHGRHALSPELHIKTLDLQLAHQEEMKKILNEAQYQQWRKMKYQKKRAHHRRDTKGYHRAGRR